MKTYSAKTNALAADAVLTAAVERAISMLRERRQWPVTIRLNSTDTLTGKVYEAPDDSGRTALCVWTEILRFGNGYPGPSFEPVTSPEVAADGLTEARDV